MNNKISIVAAYWNRKDQLVNTLWSIEQYRHDIEIIIVDDGSTDGVDITGLANDHIRVITLKDKTWINPCIAYNVGFAEATGDVIIIQNAECVHMGDIIGHVDKNITKNAYITYGCFSINEALTKRALAGEDINVLIRPSTNLHIDRWGGTGWYNHTRFRPEMLHFCTAITKEDLYDLGGFDERYANGSAYDDNDFIMRIKRKGMDARIVDNPFVVHQHHKAFYAGDIPTMMAINETVFNSAQKGDYYDVKPFNKYYK